MQATGVSAAAALGLAGSATAAGGGGVPVQPEDISREEAMDSVNLDLDHPRVFRQPEDVEVARWNAENTEWGREIKAQILEIANNMPLGSEHTAADYFYDFPVPDEWVPNRGTDHPREDTGMWPFMDMSEEEISALQLYPEENGQYRGLDREYHFAWPYHGGWASLDTGVVCPIDGSVLTIRGFDHPGETMCQHGHVFPDTHDGIEVHDDGGGWVVPEDVPDHWAASDHVGEKFWFKAVYNGRIARVIRSSIGAIAYAYLLTEEQEYARKAALLLDLVAEPFANTGLNVNYAGGLGHGRMHRMGYSVDTLMNKFIDAADQIWNSGELDVESPTVPGMTVKENVAYNIAADGAYHMWEKIHTGPPYSRIFHNGTDRYNRSMMIASSFVGLDVGFVEWTLDGQVSLGNFLTNSVFRDGQYYEMSPVYAEDFRQTAETSYHLRDHPKYPDGRNFFDEPRYELLNVFGPLKNKVAGRDVNFGDAGFPDTKVHPEPEVGDFDMLLRFYRYTTDEEKRDEYAQLMAEAYGQDPNESLKPYDGDNIWNRIQYWSVEEDIWPLFNIEDEITGFDLNELDFEPRESELLPGRGFAHYRPDEDRFDQGAAMRYGPPLSKAHCDQLGLHIYGAGREMSYDPGHNPPTDVRTRFLRQTVAHNTVVVNEWSQVPPEAAGGVVNSFSTRDGYTVADVSDEMAYAHEDVDTFRRSTAFVDTPLGQSYMVDLFRVAGGEQHDFSFHGLGADFDTDLELSEPAEGSVATPDNRWDEMDPVTGEIDGPGADVDPPGNGYGFLAHPRSADGDEQWSATWSVREDQGAVGGENPGKMRLTMLPDEDREVVVADGPEVLSYHQSIDPDDRVNYALARNDGDSPTQFVSVIEAVENEVVVDAVEELAISDAPEDPEFDPVALKASLADGVTADYFLSTTGPEEFDAKPARDGSLSTDADFAMARTDDDGIERVRLESGTHFHVSLGRSDGVVVQGTESDGLGEDGTYSGEIVEIDYDGPSLLVDAPFPEGDQLDGHYALIDAPEYSRNSQYEIESVEREGEYTRIHLVDTDMTLSQGTVEAIEDENVILSPTDFPMTWTRSHYVGGRGNEYFDGRLTVVNLDTGARATVTDSDGDRRLTVEDASGFDPGDTFVVLDVKAGDDVSVPLSVEIRRTGDGYDVDAPDDVRVRTPDRDR